ncbi:MAG: 2Fe-2S iron-sulfur cluster-binding protein [Granulosicoccus sp.]
MSNLDNKRYFSSFDESALWHESEPLLCTSVVPEAPNVATFSFCSPSGAWFKFKPGQFIQLDLPLDQGTQQRVYTISSSPSRPLSLSVTVKAQKDSVGGRWMLDQLKPGMSLSAKGPNGIFVLPDDKPRKYLFISAGSGITPSLAMTTYLFDIGKAPDICFVHCAQRPSDIIARRHVESMVSREPKIKLHYLVEEDDPYSVWAGYRGRLTQLMLGIMAPDYVDREVFCCGPEPFMQSVRDMLNALGFDMAHYQQESFGPLVSESANEVELNDTIPNEESASKVVFSRSNVETECLQTDTVLAVAKASGLNIPSGCTMGLCGTCKVKKTSGVVHMVHNGGISTTDIKKGFILACCSHPMGSVEIDI